MIKPADKGGNIVIMNKQEYIQEGLRQLSDSNHHEILEEDPTQPYNNQIYQVLQQASNLNIIDILFPVHVRTDAILNFAFIFAFICNFPDNLAVF